MATNAWEVETAETIAAVDAAAAAVQCEDCQAVGAAYGLPGDEENTPPRAPRWCVQCAKIHNGVVHRWASGAAQRPKMRKKRKVDLEGEF